MDCSAGPFSAASGLCGAKLFAARPGRRFSQRNRKRWRVALRYGLAIFLLASVSLIVFLVHSYRSYAKLVDARLAHGYLISRAGIYAAPRTLRAGQKFSRATLADALARAGYVENSDAGEVWNGSFSTSEGAIEIRPNKGLPSSVRITFDRDQRIAGLAGDDVAIDSFTLQPEPLTNDASIKAACPARWLSKTFPPS